MDKKFGYFVFGGALIGALLGWMWSASSNPLIGMGIGAFVGLAIGWFAAAAMLQQNNNHLTYLVIVFEAALIIMNRYSL